jgi:serine protease Do
MRLPTRVSILFGACIATAAVACHRQDSNDSPPAPPAKTAPASPSTAAAAPSAPAVVLPSGHTIADVAEKVTPSVVNVFSERVIDRRASPLQSDPFFDFFFGPRRGMSPAPQRERALGSGVIVGSDGIILTNNHVVADAETIRVALKDGRELAAKVVGTDPPSDIAVLRVDAKQLPAIEAADSTKTRIGDLVLAVGNPFGIGQTVTMGIISAVGRANMGITDYEDFIQTDAAINPGNSGGALVDMNGRLIGINTAIASRTGGYMGIGFAIPSSMAMQIERAILNGGKVQRGWLGVAIQDITPDLARALDIAPRHGVLVSSVTRDSPAAKAGLVRGDVIASIDGTAVNDAGQLRTTIALAGKGKRIAVQVERHGKPTTIDVTLGELPAERQAPVQVEGGLLSGLSVQPLDQAQRQRLHVPDDIDGVVVTGMERGGTTPTGVREGDVIVEVNRKPVTTVEAFQSAARAAGDQVLLLVYRDGATIYLSLSR